MTVIPRSSFKIGKIFGISIEINYTWFIVFGLISLSLGTSYFPIEYPRFSKTLDLFLGVITAVFFFLSVLFHELSHSLVARRNGVIIKKITLFIFGGVAQMTSEPSKPKEEFKMAIAGPAMSFFLSFVFGIIYWFSGNFLAVSAVSLYLAEINLILGIFNLFPGFPLDGGRVLRSLIWHFTGDLTKATKIASKAGEAFAALLIFSGFLIILGGSLINGIWLIFIGWFLHHAAQASYQNIVFENMLAGIEVNDIMTKDIEVVPPLITLEYLVNEYFMRFRHSRFPVVLGDRLLGMITFFDVKNIPREKWLELKVEDVLIPLEKLAIIKPEEKSIKALARLSRDDIGYLLVVDDDQKLIGLVTRMDIMRVIRLKSELEI